MLVEVVYSLFLETSQDTRYFIFMTIQNYATASGWLENGQEFPTQIINRPNSVKAIVL